MNPDPLGPHRPREPHDVFAAGLITRGEACDIATLKPTGVGPAGQVGAEPNGVIGPGDFSRAGGIFWGTLLVVTAAAIPALVIWSFWTMWRIS